VRQVHFSLDTMSFTLRSPHDVGKEITSCFDSLFSIAKCKYFEDLSEAALISPQIKKNALASVILKPTFWTLHTVC
jgi:hypothetical protein